MTTSIQPKSNFVFDGRHVAVGMVGITGLILSSSLLGISPSREFLRKVSLASLVAIPAAAAAHVVTRDKAAKRETELREDVSTHLDQVLDLSEECRELMHELYETKEELDSTRTLVGSYIKTKQLDDDFISFMQGKLERLADESSAQVQSLQDQLKALELEEVLPPPIGWPLVR